MAHIKMTRLNPVIAIALLCCSIICACSNVNNSETTEDISDSESTITELESAFDRMWDNVTLSNAPEYFKTDVSEDFFTVNADGIVQNKEELLADTMRLELLEILDFKFFDQRISAYNDVGIINGRIQAYSEDIYVGEVFYTAIFVKEGGIWKYKNWQGTWSKDSPPPPAFMEES